MHVVTRALGALFLTVLMLAPAASAHHGDTPDQAEAPPPGPIALYHHYLLMEQELEDLKAAHPDKMKFKVIGQSVLGLNIYGVEVTNFASDDPPIEERERLYFDGSIHSNEQLGMEAAMDIVRWLLQDYETDDLAKFSVDNRRTFVVPLVNPDGNIRDSRRNANDVDLNRNFPAGWGGPGSSARGEAPLSEPETQAVAAYLQEVVPHYSNSFHTGTLMLLHPYGNFPRESNITSPDHEMYTMICQEIQDEMNEANGGQEVPCGQVFSTIYPASGTTVDYVYDEFGSNSWTFEVDNEQNLLFSVEEIRPRLGETWVAVKHAYENVHRYGALLEFTQIVPLVDGGRVVGLSLTVENTGMGASNNTRLYVGETVIAALPSIAPGETQTVRHDWGIDLGPGDSIHLSASYNKTFFKGFHETIEVPLGVVGDGGGGIRLERLDGQEAGVALAEPEVQAPGFGLLVLALSLMVALYVGARRR